MSEALHGTVTLLIGARTYTLQPTLEAALRIESHFGGLRNALESMRMLSIGSSAEVVLAAAGLARDQHAVVASEIFRSGVAVVAGKLTEYLTFLLNPVPPSVAERGKAEAASTAQ